MFNFHNRQYVFRQSNGELWNFYCDSRQNLCYNSLTRRGTWSNGSVLIKNVYHYFYADMDQDDTFHLIFQDSDGNINYSRLNGQSIKSVPLLNSKTPAVYNKQLFLAPFRNNVHFFYVLQHENSFMLAYQVLSNNKISNPRVIDYVSGSSLPCMVCYDKAQNLYVFYQSYDGKYLQLGYKKLSTTLKSWSEFTPITKYSGNCEYPHVSVDDSGIIHLCYQRRAPKFFEMVYQQKTPDRNLWSAEEIVHSSVHSFENASILQESGNITVYWVREETIYYNSSSLAGNNWGKAARFNFTAGRQLQCLSYKSNSPAAHVVGMEEGDTSPRRETTQLPPVIYPGTLSSGLKLAFAANDSIEDVTQLFGFSEDSAGAGVMGESSRSDGSSRMGDGSQFSGGSSGRGNTSSPSSRHGVTGSKSSSGLSNSSGSSGNDLKSLMLDAFKQLQHRVDEVRDGASATKEELTKLTNAYNQLNRELAKYTIRLNMLESQLGQAKKTGSRLDELSNEIKALKEVKVPKEVKTPETVFEQNEDVPDESTKTVLKQEVPASGKTTEKLPLASLDPDKLKEWEEWEEPKEWQEG
jgi:archaellum component FlaC